MRWSNRGARCRRRLVHHPPPDHSGAGAVAVGLDGEQPVALWPEGEDLLELAGAATPLGANTTGVPVPAQAGPAAADS